MTGLIPGGDPNDSRLVERLAKEYICKESCIILLTIACESLYICHLRLYQVLIVLIADLENQGARRLAAEYDPHGSRTIGIPNLWCVPDKLLTLTA